MYKTMKFVALASVFAFILLGSLAYAQEKDMGPYNNMYEPGVPFDSGWAGPYGQETPATVTMEHTGAHSIEASDLIGYRLFGTGGWDLGTISDYVIDQTHGRIALVILSDVPGFGDEKVAVPFNMLTRTEGRAFTINFPAGSPISWYQSDFRHAYVKAMEAGKIDRPIDAAFIESTYSRFGAAPYWAEGDMNAGCLFSYYNQLLGHQVAFAQGGTAGRTNDFVFDVPDGRVSLLVLDDVPGRTDSLVAVPFGLLTMGADNTFALDSSSDQLASAPIFNEGSGNSRAFAATVYSHYGVQPYWTEDEMMSH